MSALRVSPCSVGQIRAALVVSRVNSTQSDEPWTFGGLTALRRRAISRHGQHCHSQDDPLAYVNAITGKDHIMLFLLPFIVVIGYVFWRIVKLAPPPPPTDEPAPRTPQGDGWR
jgi:hypothetical protein